MQNVVRAIRRAALMGVAAIGVASTPVAAQGAPGSGASGDPASLIVGATAEIRVAPDRAELTIAVESRGRSAAAASAETARIQTAVLDAVRRQGVPAGQIQTRSVQVTPEYQSPREGGRPTITGYVARNAVNVTLSDLSKVGPVIDAALTQGATNVDGPRLTLSNPDSARREALDAAVRKAMADARVMARAANVRVGRVLEMSTQGSGESLEMARPAMMMRASADAPVTPIEAGMISVQATVQLRVAIFP
jgi:uncharacterized protein YggE